jgi:hypothetical protein
MINLMILFSTFILLLGSGTVSAQECNDEIPTDCNEVLFLGEDKNDCACFVCNPSGENGRKVVCVTDPDSKRRLYRLPRSRPETPER